MSQPNVEFTEDPEVDFIEEEAATTKQPSLIRNMFAIMIASGELSSPFTLGAVQGKHGGGLSLPGQTNQHSSRVQ